MTTWPFLVLAMCLVSMTVGRLVMELWWFFREMPRYRRTYLAEMSARYPEAYRGVSWPIRWQDRLYAKFSRG